MRPAAQPARERHDAAPRVRSHSGEDRLIGVAAIARSERHQEELVLAERRVCNRIYRLRQERSRRGPENERECAALTFRGTEPADLDELQPDLLIREREFEFGVLMRLEIIDGEFAKLFRHLGSPGRARDAKAPTSQ